MNLTAILAILLAAAVAAGAFFYNRWDAADTRADLAEAAVEAAKESMRIEHENFDKELAIARTQPAVTAGVKRLCHHISVPVSAPRSTDATGADAGTRLAEGLAADVIACQRNGQRLGALQDWVRTNSETATPAP